MAQKMEADRETYLSTSSREQSLRLAY